MKKQLATEGTESAEEKPGHGPQAALLPLDGTGTSEITLCALCGLK